MMNSYIEVILKEDKNGIGGSLMTTASFKLDNIQAPFYNIAVKIDTGCSVSTVPLLKFQALENLCKRLKHDDINNNVHSLTSYGVETGGFKHTQPVSYDDKMKCSALKFKHSIDGIVIGGVKVEHNFIYVNYNRKGNILIGMDILSKLDIHIAKSKILNKTIMLACPKESLNDKYFKALNEHFGIGDDILTAEIYDDKYNLEE